MASRQSFFGENDETHSERLCDRRVDREIIKSREAAFDDVECFECQFFFFSMKEFCSILMSFTFTRAKIAAEIFSPNHCYFLIWYKKLTNYLFFWVLLKIPTLESSRAMRNSLECPVQTIKYAEKTSVSYKQRLSIRKVVPLLEVESSQIGVWLCDSNNNANFKTNDMVISTFGSSVVHCHVPSNI